MAQRLAGPDELARCRNQCAGYHLHPPSRKGRVISTRADQSVECKQSHVLLLTDVRGSQHKAPQVRDARAGGVLLVGPTDPAIAHLEATGMPLVLVEHHVPGRAFDCVLSDNFAGGRLAAEHLINAGHQHIAFISGPALDARRPMSTLAPVELRANGYRTALLDAVLPIDYALYEPSNLTPEGGYLACKRLLQRDVEFTALFCANDSTAVGALKALREAGRSVPGDVSLVAYGDYMDIAAQLTPALTTVHTDQVGAGMVAVQRLITRAARPELPRLLHLLHVELVQRESVRPPIGDGTAQR